MLPAQWENVLQPEKVSSCLTTEKRGMDRIMLEVVAAGLVRSPNDILSFIHYTLLAADCEATSLEEKEIDAAPHEPGGDEATTPLPTTKQKEWHKQVAETCKTSIHNLAHQGFLLWKDPPAQRKPSGTSAEGGSSKELKQSSEGQWGAHKLAAAALRANISPEEALTVNEDVASVARELCLESDLHLMYLVAPVKANETLKWQMVYQVVDHAHTHNPVMQAVCKRTGVDMEFARRLGQAKKVGYKPEVCTWAFSFNPVTVTCLLTVFLIRHLICC